jgi:hypothetical protein
MNKETRIQKIAEITAREPYGKQDILWHDKLKSMGVYEIPLEYLIYNKYNGRILSRTKTLERQGKDINPETEEGKRLIEDLLWKSKEGRNDITQKDIFNKGQLKVGIITKDGLVIDGNRRLMLLNKIKPKYRYFKAIVLPVALEDDPIEIEKLETTYQMGEDEKLGYNPIEKYLKAKQIYKKLREQSSHEESIKEIAEWMGESTGEIEKYLFVVDLIDEYLSYLHYEGIYAMADTPNDGKEDLFLQLRDWMKTFDGKESNKGFDGYSQLDVDDLRHIIFDYIRAKIGNKLSFDGKIIRKIADGQKKSHFFGNKEIWRDFSEKHFEAAIPAINKIDVEYPIDYSSENIEASLSNRDAKFRDEVLDVLVHNIEEHDTDLGYAKAADRPLELVDRAQKAINSIDQKHKAFSAPEVVDQIEELIKKLIIMLKQKAPERTLSLIIDLLQNMDIAPSADKKIVLTKIKGISKLAYQMEKDIKAS